MRALLFCLALFLFATGCEKNPEGISTNAFSGEVKLFTDKTLYSPSDTIQVTLANHTRGNVVIETRTGVMIMFYQKKEKGEWSHILPFYYSSLLGPSIFVTLQPGMSFPQPVFASTFNGTGTFHVVVKLIEIEKPGFSTNQEPIVFSNAFRIE
ncbi:MAG: hypothetical protein D6715_06115 [Calditrichaeota bacterium]|nr:MAG: hypothetical protein D6715_06115 [Calditrichota bacterium]